MIEALVGYLLAGAVYAAAHGATLFRETGIFSRGEGVLFVIRLVLAWPTYVGEDALHAADDARAG